MGATKIYRHRTAKPEKFRKDLLSKAAVNLNITVFDCDVFT